MAATAVTAVSAQELATAAAEVTVNLTAQTEQMVWRALAETAATAVLAATWI